MRRSVLLILIIALSLFNFCGKKKNPSETVTPIDKTLASQTVSALNPQGVNYSGSSEQIAAVFYIKECRYEPEKPTAFTDITVVPIINEEFSTDESILRNISFQYRWIINKTEITGIKENKLPKTFFKKKDWIQCRVQAFFNDKKTAEYRGNLIRIQNSPPSLNLQSTSEIKIPGEFTYQITASDPDNDPLTYSLIAPLDLGININTETGLIVWPINEELAKKSPANEIKFAVSDSDGGKAEGSIIINFLTKEIEKK